jgi:hypothetical protein
VINYVHEDILDLVNFEDKGQDADEICARREFGAF